MNINKFENTIKQLFTVDEETGLFNDELILMVAADGCLSAKLNGESIPCEGEPWNKALDIIISFINRKT